MQLACYSWSGVEGLCLNCACAPCNSVPASDMYLGKHHRLQAKILY